jgi:hypothetical protein
MPVADSLANHMVIFERDSVLGMGHFAAAVGGETNRHVLPAGSVCRPEEAAPFHIAGRAPNETELISIAGQTLEESVTVTGDSPSRNSTLS